MRSLAIVGLAFEQLSTPHSKIMSHWEKGEGSMKQLPVVQTCYFHGRSINQLRNAPKIFGEQHSLCSYIHLQLKLQLNNLNLN